MLFQISNMTDFRFVYHIQQKINSARDYDKKRKWKAGNIEVGHVLELAKRQNNKCWKCEDEMMLHSWMSNCCYQFSIDRINNLEPHNYDNCLLACSYCNCHEHGSYTQKNKICDAGCHVDERTLKQNKVSDVEKFLLRKKEDKMEFVVGKSDEIKEYLDDITETRGEVDVLSGYCRNNPFPTLLEIRKYNAKILNDNKANSYNEMLVRRFIKQVNEVYEIMKKIHENKFNREYMTSVGIKLHEKYGTSMLIALILYMRQLPLYKEPKILRDDTNPQNEEEISIFDSYEYKANLIKNFPFIEMEWAFDGIGDFKK